MSTSEPEQLAAGCVLASFQGPVVPAWLARRIDGGLGGVLLFESNVVSDDQLAALTGELRRQHDRLVIAIDEEGGDVTRLDHMTGGSYPSALALGEVDCVATTAVVASAIAGRLRRVGVNLNLAPVADVSRGNPVLGTRTFGDDPERVARHVAAFVESTQRADVAACAKHFPGHGDALIDSHLDLPTVGADRAPHLRPFAAAIAAGVRSIMVGHLRVPQHGPEPASLNARSLRVLRDELGFTGVAITDALDMGAIATTLPVREAAVRALVAGADCLCFGPSFGERELAIVIRHVADALESGQLDREQLRVSAKRVRDVPGDLVGRESAA